MIISETGFDSRGKWLQFAFATFLVEPEFDIRLPALLQSG